MANAVGITAFEAEVAGSIPAGAAMGSCVNERAHRSTVAQFGRARRNFSNFVAVGDQAICTKCA